jgi:hypothetical protein
MAKTPALGRQLYRLNSPKSHSPTILNRVQPAPRLTVGACAGLGSFHPTPPTRSPLNLINFSLRYSYARLVASTVLGGGPILRRTTHLKMKDLLLLVLCRFQAISFPSGNTHIDPPSMSSVLLFQISYSGS